MKVPSAVRLCAHCPHGPGVVTAAQESKWSYRAVRLGLVKWKGESSAAKSTGLCKIRWEVGMQWYNTDYKLTCR